MSLVDRIREFFATGRERERFVAAYIRDIEATRAPISDSEIEERLAEVKSKARRPQ